MRTQAFKCILALIALLVFSLSAMAESRINISRGQLVYVPVYSHVYQGLKNQPYNLSALLSVRNVDIKHSISITEVKYYNSAGEMLRSYLEQPIVVPPMGTKEYYIPERDHEGGSGANFTVLWEGGTTVSVPIIQAVMIGTASTQGISFVCDGVAIEEH